MILIFTGCDLLWFDLISYDTQKYVIYQHGRPMCTLIKLWWNVHVHSFHKFSRNPRWFLSFIQSKHWKYYSCHWVFCWVMGGWGCFLSFQAAPYWWRPITNFGFAKSKIPFHIFPHQSLFRHFKHVYGLIFKHESVFWKRPQRFYAERICLKIKSSQEQPDHGHTVKCTLCMKMSTSTYIRIMIFRNVNSLSVFSERNFV